MNCSHCGKPLLPVALFEDVYACAKCKETWYLPHDIATGRSWPALKEGRVFDAEKLAASPLFERRLF